MSEETWRDIDVDETESRFQVDKLTPGGDDSMALFSKHLRIQQALSNFWKERLEMHKKCKRYERRDIFTRGARMKYMNVQNKWPIEPQVLRPIITSVSKQIKRAVRSHRITMEDTTPPQNVAPPEVMNVVVKWMETQLKLEPKKDRALREGLCGGYPQWLLFEEAPEAEGIRRRLEATLLPPESTLCSPRFYETDGSDIDELMYSAKKTKKQLLDLYPDRAGAFDEHVQALKDDPGRYNQLLTSDNMEKTAEDRANMHFDINVGEMLGDEPGLYTIFRHMFQVSIKKEVFIHEKTGDVIELPESWEDWRKEAWRNANPDYSIRSTTKIPTLWVVTFGSNGFIWENGPHWFQQRWPDNDTKCLFPAVPFIADLVDNIPMGIGEDLLPLVLMKAVVKTEALSEVRKGSGRTAVVQEGALRNPSRVGHELSREDGVIVVKKNTLPKEAIDIVSRQPNDIWFNLDERLSAELQDTHGVQPSMMGAFAPRQSDRAKNTEIDQSLSVQGNYVDNYSNFNAMITQLLCYFIPQFINEEVMVEIDDEYGKPQKAMVNQQDWDNQGIGYVVANDLTSARYRVVPVRSDDSPTSRQADLKEFAELLEAIGNTLLQLDPKFLANFLSTLPNRYAREAGKFMLEHADEAAQGQAAQAQAEQELQNRKLDDRYKIEVMRATTPRIMMKTDAKDIQEAPMGFQVLAQYISDLQKSGVIPKEPVEQPGQPGQGGGPEQGGQVSQEQAMQEAMQAPAQ